MDDPTSINAKTPSPQLLAYATTKGVIANFTAGLAGPPAELAGAYVLLASDEASYITGAIIPVTGGKPML